MRALALSMGARVPCNAAIPIPDPPELLDSPTREAPVCFEPPIRRFAAGFRGEPHMTGMGPWAGLQGRQTDTTHALFCPHVRLLGAF